VFSVAKVVKTFGPEPGITESLDDFRYKTEVRSTRLRFWFANGQCHDGHGGADMRDEVLGI
jgi:hypothetical protein